MTWSFDAAQRPLLAHAEALSALPWLRHGFALSDEGTPDGFNLSFTTSADADQVVANRRAVCSSLGFLPEALTLPSMPHSAAVVRVGPQERGHGGMNRSTALPGCDALITDTPGLLLGVTAADCLSVFLVDPVHRAIGLAHSGWRGTAGRIVPNTLDAMTAAFGTRPQECLAAIGPGISGAGYEVDSPVFHAFSEPPDAGIFTPTRPGHWLLDLTAAVQYQLLSCGVPSESLFVSPWRTDQDTPLFHSHRLQPGCPRMGAFLGMP
ncbi:MAG: Multi-copper polyphenol oxidoreductase, laccase [Chthonomonadaceae bacterium]|nr:Multi-copper polyphenol oxidoreductase, laccase [Chthonomonadaceae bacterium]